MYLTSCYIVQLWNCLLKKEKKKAGKSSRELNNKNMLEIKTNAFHTRRAFLKEELKLKKKLNYVPMVAILFRRLWNGKVIIYTLKILINYLPLKKYYIGCFKKKASILKLNKN